MRADLLLDSLRIRDTVAFGQFAGGDKILEYRAGCEREGRKSYADSHNLQKPDEVICSREISICGFRR